MRRFGRDIVAVLPAWVAARLLVVLGFVLADAVLDHEGHAAVARRLGLLAWDGTFYRDIAVGGYGPTAGESLRFFPLYPLLGRLGAVGISEGAALVVIANLSAIVAAVLLARLVEADGGGRGRAQRSAMFLLLVPPAFVLSFAYSEALFLALSIGCVLAVRTDRWGVAAWCGLGAALCRPIGVVLVVPIAIEGWKALRASGRSRRPRPLWVGAALAAPAVGLAAFGAYAQWRYDQWDAPLHQQSALRGDLVDPVSRLVRGLGDLAGSERVGDGLHVPFAILAVVLVVLGARRLPASYTAYAATLVVLALAAENLNSLERYLVGAFPLILVVADRTSGRRAEWLALALCGGGTVALTALALMDVYVP